MMTSSDLERVAQEADELTRLARERLVAAVRRGAAQGMTQAEIARSTGRSQPEISRLLHFHGTGPLARRLRTHRKQVIDTVKAAGGSDVRVFGSVATGEERPNSDIDLLFRMGSPLSLFELADLEIELGKILGAEVDLVPDTSLYPFLRERVLTEAVTL